MVLPWLYILMSLLALAVSVQSQPGFLSIDCGIPGDFNYTDDTTQMFYTSDAKFIDTGTNKEITAIHMTQTLPRQYRNLRIFPDGIRNCYTLTPVIKSNRYLLRASFMYGNYDGLDQPPQFDAYVGVDRWEINLPSNSSLYVWNEIIMVASLDYISVCLVKTGNGIPFISTLELRLLDNSTYQAANESQSLRLYTRLDPGSTSGQRIRYPDDDYDRMWSPWVENFWTPIDTSFSINLRKDDGYQPALAVMNTSAMPTNTSGNLSFYFPTSHVDPRSQYHVFFHFAELERLQKNQSREFNFSIDGKYVYGPFSPEYLSVDTIFTQSPLSGKDQHVVDLYKTTSSTLPPILNAVEIFTVEQLTSPTDGQDVDAIMNIKAIYQIKRNWTGDPCVPSSYIWEGLNCSSPDSKPPTIISLDLSSSGLAGVLAPSLANLTSIQSLDVSNNSLTGPVPDFLAQLSSLKILNLTNNQFTGPIPAILLDKSKDGSLSLSFDNNTNLSGPPDINHCEAGSCKKKRKILVPILASSISALVVLIIMVFVLRKFTQRRRQREAVVWDKTDGSIHKMQYGRNGSLHSENQRFTYTEVVNMTNNFERPIGNGGFGTVYHGQMREGTQVAVKMLSLQSVKVLSHPRQGCNEFQNEAQLLMRVHHKNVVPFIGYCQEGDNMALIYEYMALGNLGSHLSGTNSNSKALNWGQRLCIALDVALGLEYLHNGCRPPIIHRDMKTTNILLNERLEAKIGDFGMSKVFLQDDEFTHISTAVKGTAGYLDPEYFNSNNLTHRSDVYSFGVVLLELITGRPAIIRNADYEKRTLVDWACPIIAGGDVQSVVDPRLEGDYDINSLWKVAEIVLACTSPRSIERPTMTEVVAELKDCLGTETTAERTRSLNIDQVEKTSSITFQPSPR
ncbi:putative LRR receptor-like serine/threonine-protein kinase [Cinnamomum micranthum f. kanehirae]|uniref:non-specific serine/threonine protein kinase n=1 Tax=Cinnamomum micranthum f. kanehirae TaxID=337451 RepID=A0A443NHY6_9MAGN|nr:putative LRR receptor-like serine/threonine-protein kinase [Cinnamomum micranthum f. kanehirae]